MVLNPEGILPDQIVFKSLDNLMYSFRISPAGGLSQAGQAGICTDTDEVPTTNKIGFDVFNFDGLYPLISLTISR